MKCEQVIDQVAPMDAAALKSTAEFFVGAFWQDYKSEWRLSPAKLNKLAGEQLVDMRMRYGASLGLPSALLVARSDGQVIGCAGVEIGLFSSEKLLPKNRQNLELALQRRPVLANVAVSPEARGRCVKPHRPAPLDLPHLPRPRSRPLPLPRPALPTLPRAGSMHAPCVAPRADCGGGALTAAVPADTQGPRAPAVPGVRGRGKVVGRDGAAAARGEREHARAQALRAPRLQGGLARPDRQGCQGRRSPARPPARVAPPLRPAWRPAR